MLLLSLFNYLETSQMPFVEDLLRQVRFSRHVAINPVTRLSK